MDGPGQGRGRARAIGLACALAAGLVAACGTRLPDEAFTASGNGGAVVDGGSGSGASGAGGGAAGATGAGTGSGATSSGSGTATGTGTGSGATGGGAATGAGATDPGAGTDAGAADPAAGGAAAAGPNEASDVGVTESTITIGTIVAENGVLGDAFAPAATGLRSWVEYINAQGGIGGRTVVLSTCDDREDRARTLECARRLVEEDQVFALIATNTRALGGAAQYLHDQGVPVLGNPINNSFYRYDNFFTVYGAPYVRDNTNVGADGQLSSYSTVPRFFASQLGATSAAVFNYDIAESTQAGAFMIEGLRQEGITVDNYVVSFAAPSFDAAVAEMQRKGTQLIFDAMDEGANRRLCDAMDRRQFTVLAKVSTIPLMGDSLGANFGDACRPVTFVAGDSIPYTDTSNPFVAAYRDNMARYQPGKELHQWGLEAWVMGDLLREALVTMGPAPTRAGFEAYLNSLQAASPAGVMTPTIQWTPGDLSAATVHDCIAVAKWDDTSGGWIEAGTFPFCVDDAHQFFTPVAEQGN